MPRQTTPAVERIDLKTAREHMETMTFIDTRSRTALRRDPNRIPGAIHLPVKEFDQRVKHVYRQRPIVAYCTWSHEKTSARVARMLKEHGFGEVYALRGGFKAWQSAGLPVEPVKIDKDGRALPIS